MKIYNCFISASVCKAGSLTYVETQMNVLLTVTPLLKHSNFFFNAYLQRARPAVPFSISLAHKGRATVQHSSRTHTHTQRTQRREMGRGHVCPTLSAPMLVVPDARTEFDAKPAHAHVFPSLRGPYIHFVATQH